ncbi:hypothetical protein AF332_14410 [Sporosarcina globispora]|uniref:N-acetyltransferase domain-containing protein n=1 Tax=Sporosarcina globispora TaxID=1459 RepID=A0A0M0GDF7_SPOGL|nr:GNAT family N-acetyltransferase [Sporosarcina globispora]KON87904.1 hypothetical protein AF332_14410 [Sporosarcina globispora]
MSLEFTYKYIDDSSELTGIADIQSLVWGEDGVIPIPLMVATINSGGNAIAAIEKNSDKIVGFCYGFPGMDRKRKPFIYSHMLAIHPDYRNAGIGKQLKLAQRQWALDYGYDQIKWTVDPLEIRNGYLNLNKLGGVVNTYLPDYYGTMTDKINNGIRSDRLLLEWNLDSGRVNQALGIKKKVENFWHTYRSILHWTGSENAPIPETSFEIQDEQGFLLAIPKEIQRIKEINTELVKEWRIITREIMMSAFKAGYSLVGVIRPETGLNYYVFEKQ